MSTARDSRPAPYTSAPASRFLGLLVFVLLAHAILRGIRSPNLWSATHALFNYDFGFAKRALVGALIAIAGVPLLYTYRFFFYASLALFVANVALLIVTARRGMTGGGRHFQWGALVYFSSAGLVFLAHTIGYFDHVTMLVALCAIAIRHFALRCAFLALFMPLAILVHETGFAVFGPLLGYLLVLDLCRAPTRPRIAVAAALFILLLAEAVLLSNSNLAGESVEAMYQTLHGRADFPLRRDAFDVLARDVHANLAIMAAMRQTRPYWVELISSLLVALPAIAFLISLSIRALLYDTNRRLLIPLACAAGLSPLLLHGVGWDGVRWNTLAITMSYLVLLVTVLHGPTRPAGPLTDRSRRTTVIATLIVAFNLATTVPLLDGYTVQSFPYRAYIDYLLDVAAGNAAFPFRPER